jgi:predicted ATPase
MIGLPYVQYVPYSWERQKVTASATNKIFISRSIPQPFVIAGNFKENPESIATSLELAEGAATAIKSAAANVKVILCPPYPFIYPMMKHLGDTSNVEIGAQNCCMCLPPSQTIR